MEWKGPRVEKKKLPVAQETGLPDWNRDKPGTAAGTGQAV